MELNTDRIFRAFVRVIQMNADEQERLIVNLRKDREESLRNADTKKDFLASEVMCIDATLMHIKETLIKLYGDALNARRILLNQMGDGTEYAITGAFSGAGDDDELRGLIVQQVAMGIMALAVDLPVSWIELLTDELVARAEQLNEIAEKREVITKTVPGTSIEMSINVTAAGVDSEYDKLEGS